MSALTWKGLGLAICACIATNATTWANDGRPSQSTLAEMGLGGLVVMSDDDAMTVRGFGYRGSSKSSARVFGNSFATINTPLGGAHSENGYTADGKHFASGKNYSEAGVKISVSKGKGHKPGGKWGKQPMRGGHGKPGGHGGFSKSVTIKVFAGGHSSAKAF